MAPTDDTATVFYKENMPVGGASQFACGHKSTLFSAGVGDKSLRRLHFQIDELCASISRPQNGPKGGAVSGREVAQRARHEASLWEPFVLELNVIH